MTKQTDEPPDLRVDGQELEPCDTVFYASAPSYVAHEQWFKIRDVYKPGKHLPDRQSKGVLIVNSYGRVRKIFEDGTVMELVGKEWTGISNN